MHFFTLNELLRYASSAAPLYFPDASEFRSAMGLGELLKLTGSWRDSLCGDTRFTPVPPLFKRNKLAHKQHREPFQNASVPGRGEAGSFDGLKQE